VADNSRIEELRRRIQKDPASIAFAQLAEEHRRAGQHEDAVRVCRAGLAKHPAYLSARITLGRALLELKRLDEAAVEFEYVLKAAPDNLTAIRELGDINHRRRPSGSTAKAPAASSPVAPPAAAPDPVVAPAVAQAPVVLTPVVSEPVAPAPLVSAPVAEAAPPLPAPPPAPVAVAIAPSPPSATAKDPSTQAKDPVLIELEAWLAALEDDRSFEQPVRKDGSVDQRVARSAGV
jgi:tetratricopeptide (TPR) repeat protein